MNYIIRAIDFLFHMVSIALVILIILILIPLSKPYVKNYNSYTVLRWASQVDQSVRVPFKQSVQKIIPTQVGQWDLSRLYLIVLIFVLMNILNRIAYRLSTFAIYRSQKEDLMEWERGGVGKAGHKTIDEIEDKLEELRHAKAKTRKQLVMDIVTLKEQLEEMKHELAFLSIDVVGSTAMKESEDKLTIQYDFDRYNEIVTRILKENNCIKYATTPDGIMAAFVKPSYAVSSAQTLLDELVVFNRDVKKMKQKFSVRLGINSGIVIYDASEPLESLSDRAVDIAGHMQKHAAPDTIFISGASFSEIEALQEGFVEIDRVVDDEKVYQWKGKSV